MGTFAVRFAALLEQRHIDQADVAAHFGVNQSTVSQWCNGQSLPRIGRAEQLAEFMGLEPGEVLKLLARSDRERRATATRSAGRTAPPEPTPSPDASPSLQHLGELSTGLETRLAAVEASLADLHAEQIRAMSEHSQLVAVVQRLQLEVERVVRVVSP
jgi:transcriptional regulator with XRE-family HTH domain